ncbi:MAG: hydantoinase B/oxoprolinase family protein [Pseudomonadota bacterium]
MCASSLDPFTHGVIQAGFEAVAAEMFDTLRKTAMSPIIYEVLDVGTGVLDADGALVASGAGIPGFIGVLDKAVRAILAQETAPLRDGDVFVLNDPNLGGVTHLCDVVVAAPVFHEGERVAFVASIAHWGDIGGAAPGSMAVDAIDIVAEGLRLPPVRLYAAGRPNAAVADIITANTRLPAFVAGDLAAQCAAARRGILAVKALFARYGTATLKASIKAGFIEGEARARAGLARLPNGHVPIQARQDDGSVWRVAITVSDDRFTVDLRDAPDCVAGPHNTSRDGALVVCQMLFKALTDPERFANAGSFAPLAVLTRPGSIFDASPTAPQGYYFETRIRLFDCLWRAIATAMPKTLPAGHFATIFGTVIAGVHPDTGQRTTMVEPQMGGWGATAERSGTGPLYSSSHGDTFNCPAEIAEARYGLEVVERTLNPAPPVADGFAGGPGLLTRLRIRGAASLSVGHSHGREPVWCQGAEGTAVNRLTVERASGATERHQFVSALPLSPGDEIIIETAPGGSASG